MINRPPELLDALQVWVKGNGTELTRRGVSFSLESSDSERSKLSSWLTLETDESIGRLTVWESGEAELECADVETGAVWNESTNISAGKSLLDLIGVLLTRIGCDFQEG